MEATQSAASGFRPYSLRMLALGQSPRSTQSDDRHRKRLDFPDAEAVADDAAAIHVTALLPRRRILRFESACRRSTHAGHRPHRLTEVLPLLYLHGLSSSDFGPALEEFLGTSRGLSAAIITRLTRDWQDEAAAFNQRSLADAD